MLAANPNPGNFAPHVVNGSEYEESHDRTTNMPKPLVKFFKGEPEALGATQVFVGAVLLSIGISVVASSGGNYGTEAMTIMTYTGMPLWSGIMFVTSGSVSIAASVKPTMGKVRASLVLNIISSLAASIAIVMLLIGLSIRPFFHYNERFTCIFQQDMPCLGEVDEFAFLQGIALIFLLFVVLVFCVTISSSVFGCKTVCRTAYTEMNVMVYQSAPVNQDTMAEILTLSTAPLPSAMHGGHTEHQSS